MAFLEKIAKHKRIENPAIDAFVASAQRNIQSVVNGTFTNRSWARQSDHGFVVKFGKLEGTYDFGTKEEVLEVLHEAIADVRSDAEFRAMVEAAYGETATDEPVKPKRAYKKRKSAEG